MGKTNWGELGLILIGRAMFNKSLIQFSVGGWGCNPSLLFGLRPNCLPKPPPEIPRHSQRSLTRFLVGTLLLSPCFWYAQGYVWALPVSASPVLWKFYNQIPLASKVKFPGAPQSLCQIPQLGNLLWVLELL